ncbi:MAG TPA: hypothetical protein VLV46_03915 [Gaiellaceae bacterium]|nr:hypothetical protein [Gaiellaceae bacterium]
MRTAGAPVAPAVRATFGPCSVGSRPEQITVDGTHDWPGRQGELGRRHAAKFLDRYLG